MNKYDNFVIDVDDGCLSRRLNLSERVFCLSCMRPEEQYPYKLFDDQFITVIDKMENGIM